MCIRDREVVVTANQFDRDLAARFDFVRIEDDKAIYANHWKAGGNEITWDMIHYDVQLFGCLLYTSTAPHLFKRLSSLFLGESPRLA